VKNGWVLYFFGVGKYQWGANSCPEGRMEWKMLIDDIRGLDFIRIGSHDDVHVHIDLYN